MTPSASPRVGPLRDFLQRVAPGELGVFCGGWEDCVGQSLDFLGEGHDMLDPNFQTLWDAVDGRNPAIASWGWHCIPLFTGFLYIPAGAGFLPSTVSLQYLIWFQWPTKEMFGNYLRLICCYFVGIFLQKNTTDHILIWCFLGCCLERWIGLVNIVLIWRVSSKDADPFLSYCYHSSLLPPKKQSSGHIRTSDKISPHKNCSCLVPGNGRFPPWVNPTKSLGWWIIFSKFGPESSHVYTTSLQPKNNHIKQNNLGGGFIFLNVHPYVGKIPILTSIFFQMGWFNHHLATHPTKFYPFRHGFKKPKQI